MLLELLKKSNSLSFSLYQFSIRTIIEQSKKHHCHMRILVSISENRSPWTNFWSEFAISVGWCIHNTHFTILDIKVDLISSVNSDVSTRCKVKLWQKTQLLLIFDRYHPALIFIITVLCVQCNISTLCMQNSLFNKIK